MDKDNKYLILLPIFIITSALSAWVLSVLWGWFIVPVFNLRSVSGLEMYGLILIASYWHKPMIDPDFNVIKVITDVISLPITLLIGGWILHELILRFPA